MQNNKVLRFLTFFIGCLLFVDGLVLILNKKIHLGTVLPLLIGCIFICTSLWIVQIQRFLSQHHQLKKIWNIGWSVFGIWLISLIAFFSFIHFKAQQNTLTDQVQAIIVLGSGISQGKPTATLAKRLDKATEIAQQQPQAIIIVSGGLDYGETKTEAEIMSEYLQQQNIAAQRIFQESKSTSTDLNLKNSQQYLIQQHLRLDSKIAIVTSDFHTLRAAAIAKKQGYRNFITVGAETPVSTRYNAWLREYFAYMSGWVLGEY